MSAPLPEHGLGIEPKPFSAGSLARPGPLADPSTGRRPRKLGGLRQAVSQTKHGFLGILVAGVGLVALCSLDALPAAGQTPSKTPTEPAASASNPDATSEEPGTSAVPVGQAGSGEAESERAAYHLRQGSVARSRIVALGKDLILDGSALSHAVAISGSAIVSGTVEGDVIVLGGEAILSENARVVGDVYVLGGHIDMAPGASIGGRSVAYPEASDLWVSLIGSPSMGLPATSRVVLGAKLALLAFWCFVMLLALSVARRELVATSESIQVEPFHNFFLGLTGVAAMVLTALFFSAFSGALLGVPLLVLVAVVALLLRFWGMVAVFHALGSWLHRQTGRRVPVALTAATWGLLVLGIVKMVPYLGIWVWSLATFIGVGAALETKLGRREAWFEP